MSGIHLHYQSKAEPHKGQSQLVDLQGCSAITGQVITAPGSESFDSIPLSQLEVDGIVSELVDWKLGVDSKWLNM
jgi:hypothetical protein